MTDTADTCSLRNDDNVRNRIGRGDGLGNVEGKEKEKGGGEKEEKKPGNET
jgi:hypothetical protein